MCNSSGELAVGCMRLARKKSTFFFKALAMSYGISSDKKCIIAGKLTY